MKQVVLLLTCCLLLAGKESRAQLSPVSYADGAAPLKGFYAKPAVAATGKPGILILPAWKGIDSHSREVAQKLSALGYASFIADIYGEGNQPADREQAAARSGFYKKNIESYRRRIRLALEQLLRQGADPERIVVIGYCFGGLGAIEAARSNMPVKGIVSFHGSYERADSTPVAAIRPAMLILHGAEDRTGAQLPALADELRQAGADWQLISYAKAVHAFSDPSAGDDPAKGAAYNAQADRRSWLAMLQFLDELSGR